jgi:hypothetical protein
MRRSVPAGFLRSLKRRIEATPVARERGLRVWLWQLSLPSDASDEVSEPKKSSRVNHLTSAPVGVT